MKAGGGGRARLSGESTGPGRGGLDPSCDERLPWVSTLHLPSGNNIARLTGSHEDSMK